MEFHTKVGVLQHPHPSSVIPVTHHANSAQSKACLRRPGLHPGRKQDRRALPYNPLLPPRAQEAGTEELSLPPELRLLSEVVQGFAPPGTPFVTASADKPGSRPLTCRDSQGAGGSKKRAALPTPPPGAAEARARSASHRQSPVRRRAGAALPGEQEKT